MQIYQGVLKIIPINQKNGSLSEAYNIRLDETNVLNFKFLYGTSKPTLAILYQDSRDMKHVVTYEVLVKEKALSPGPWRLPNVEIGASKLVSIPSPLGGVVVVGESSLTYYNGVVAKSISIKPTIILCFAQVANDPTRVLMCDHVGRLWLLVLCIEESSSSSSMASTSQIQSSNQPQSSQQGAQSSIFQSISSVNVTGLKFELLAETSTASCIAYLDNGVAFIGSLRGDSQLIKLLDQKEALAQNSVSSSDQPEFVQLLESYTNIGPIIHMASVEMDRTISFSQNDSLSTGLSTSAVGNTSTTSSNINAAISSKSSLFGLENLVFSSTNTFTNVAASGLPQSQLVTCSGAFKDGSLRIIRNGVGIQEHASIPLAGLRSLFSFDPNFTKRPSPDSMAIDSTQDESYLPSTMFLVTCYLLETRLLKIEGTSLEEEKIDGFEHLQTSLLISNIPNSDRMLQITPKFAQIVDLKLRKSVAKWTTGSHHPINLASFDRGILAVASGCDLFLLKISNDSIDPIQIDGQKGKSKTEANVVLPHQISCLTISSVLEDQQFIAVGLWNDISIHIFALLNETGSAGKSSKLSSSSSSTKLSLSHMEHLGGEILPRSIMFANFGSGNVFLLVGLGDGNVLSFNFDPSICFSNCISNTPSSSNIQSSMNSTESPLSYKKKIPLGRQPVLLSSFNFRDRLNVMACGDRPSVFYCKNGKLLFSAMNVPNVCMIAELNTNSFPESIGIATSDGLMIGTVDDIQKLHIRKIHTGELGRRICHQRQSRTYLMTVGRYELSEEGEELETYHVKLLDDITYQTLDTYDLDENEVGESMTSIQFSGQDSSSVYYVVGTGIVKESESEPTKGRILIFKVVESSSKDSGGVSNQMNIDSSTSANVFNAHLVLVHQYPIGGIAWCMAPFNGKLLVGVNHSALILNWLPENSTNNSSMHTSSMESQNTGSGIINSDSSFQLKLDCIYTESVQILHLATKGNTVFIGDVMRGTTLLQYKPVDGRLDTLAVDYRPHWITAVAILDDRHFLASETFLNLLTTQYNPDASTSDEKERLEPVGCYHLGDLVNCFSSGSLTIPMFDAAYLTVPSVLYATVSGAIGVIASIPKELYDELLAIQNAINKVVKGIGNLDHSEWRSYYNARNQRITPASNFIDGDLVETVLELPREDQERIAAAAKLDVEDLVKKIEAIARATH